MGQRSGPPDVLPDALPNRQGLDRQDESEAGSPRRRSYQWQDPAVPAAAAPALAGLDFLRAIADGTLPAPPVARTLGFDVAAVEPGRVVF